MQLVLIDQKILELRAEEEAEVGSEDKFCFNDCSTQS